MRTPTLGERSNPCRRLLLLSLSSVLLMSACAAPRADRIRGPDMTLRVDISEAANNDSPIAVDIVFVGGEKVEDELRGVSAGDWFQTGKSDLERSRFQPGKDYLIWEFEWVPGQRFEDDPVIKQLRRYSTMMVFADYRSAGKHRWEAERGLRSLHLMLQDTAFNVEGSSKRNEKWE